MWWGSDKKRQRSTGFHALVWAHPLAHLAIAWHVRRIFGSVKARHFDFGIRIDLGKSNLIHDKILPKGA